MRARLMCFGYERWVMMPALAQSSPSEYLGRWTLVRQTPRGHFAAVVTTFALLSRIGGFKRDVLEIFILQGTVWG
jgi:hypothetical protein